MLYFQITVQLLLFFIVAKITSVIHQDRFSFPLHKANLTFDLDKPSEIRTNELNTVHKTTIKHKIGELKPQALQQLLELIKANF